MQGNYWAGMSADELATIAKKLYEHGSLLSAQYIVNLEPLHEDSKVAKTLSMQFLPDEFMFLAKSCNIPLIESQSEQINTAHFVLNHFNADASSGGEVQITFLETRMGQVSDLINDIKSVMFVGDGTQNPPYEYLLRLTISVFSSHSRQYRPISKSMVVALQSANIELAADNFNPVEIPVTFSRMFSMLD